MSRSARGSSRRNRTSPTGLQNIPGGNRRSPPPPNAAPEGGAPLGFERVLRPAIGALRPAGLLNRQINARMRVPEVHLRHRTRQRQILFRHIVLILGIGLDQRLGRRGHGSAFEKKGWTAIIRWDRRPWPDSRSG